MSEQKLREALEQIANLDYVGTDKAVAAVRMAAEIAREALAAPAEPSGNSGEFAAPAGEQVGLTEAELVEAYESEQQGRWGDHIRSLKAVIAAHEAKRASCSQAAKNSTCEVGRVDETEKSEHVGGAA